MVIASKRMILAGTPLYAGLSPQIVLGHPKFRFAVDEARLSLVSIRDIRYQFKKME